LCPAASAPAERNSIASRTRAEVECERLDAPVGEAVPVARSADRRTASGLGSAGAGAELAERTSRRASLIRRAASDLAGRHGRTDAAVAPSSRAGRFIVPTERNEIRRCVKGLLSQVFWRSNRRSLLPLKSATVARVHGRCARRTLVDGAWTAEARARRQQRQRKHRLRRRSREARSGLEPPTRRRAEGRKTAPRRAQSRASRARATASSADSGWPANHSSSKAASSSWGRTAASV
jgi:hypothetical protein